MTKKEEDAYMSLVRSLGCLICGQPASIHHIRRYGEKRKTFDKDGNGLIVPLCYDHHQGRFGIHDGLGKKRFEREYMTQDVMLELTNQRLTTLQKMQKGGEDESI